MRRERITITIRKDVIAKLDTVIDGQKMRNRSNAIETILLKEFKNYVLDTAVILSKQERISVRGKMVPKLLTTIGTTTLIERNIEVLKKFGIRTLVIVIGIGEDEIKRFLGNGAKFGVDISYAEGEGTASILRQGGKYLTAAFLMANGDILLESIDILDMYSFHKKQGGWGTIAVTATPDPSQLGSIFMKGDLVIDFKEKAKEAAHQSNLVNAGVYIIEPTALSVITPAMTSVEYDVFPELARRKKLVGYQIGNGWVHLHDKKAYQKYIAGLTE